ncbi:MAG: HEAT repeat domain-containing protein [bacterium]|nr:HEAT repeat domain-containing protein [bacterium]
MSKTFAALLIACLLAPASCPLDSWVPFQNQRVASPSGQRYVVIKEVPKKRSIRFEFCERSRERLAKIGPMSPASADAFALRKKPGAVDRDVGDRLLAKGTVGQLPYQVLVPDTLPGFLLFEQYYRVGSGRAVIWVGDKGVEKLSLTLRDLYGGVPEGALHTVSSIWWSRGVFLDEVAGAIIVVAVGDQIREVSIKEAEVSEPGIARIADWARRGTEKGRALALEVLARKQPDALKAATPTAIELFHDDKESLALRLRAAVVLARAGTPVAADRFFEAARAEDQPREVRQFAVRNLPAIVGEEAIPILRELMRGPANGVWNECIGAFAALGEPAVDTLVEMMLEEGQSNDYRGGAANALGGIKSPRSYGPLLQATATAPDYVANNACNAVIALGGDDLTERLIAILAKGCTQDGRIALYLQRHPTRAALSAIDQALARDEGEETDGVTVSDTDRKWLKEARERCAAADDGRKRR